MKMNSFSDYKDIDPALDYIANNLFPGFEHSRETLANKIMKAMYLEDGPLDKYHPTASAILEILSIKLMGAAWCKAWLEAAQSSDPIPLTSDNGGSLQNYDPAPHIQRESERGYVDPRSQIESSLYQLCLEIEKFPASEQQTKVVVMASEIMRAAKLMEEE